LLTSPATHRIGPVVAGSLGLGLLLAILLVTVPAAGAQENVVSGVVLLAFALGWALLATLSVRWTDQPQRWAYVPAALMALAGAGLLVWKGAVTVELLAWVWPPVALALAIWMLTRARRQLHSRTRGWLLYPVIAAVALAAVGATYENVREGLDRNTYAMPGQLVDVGGHSLHISCTGSGGPPVVFESGGGETSAIWGWIAPAVARETTVCVYDRAGRGWSEVASGPQDGVALATDLHTLLERTGVKGPYVLAGHSFGGLYVLNFAALYPEDVAGMVLLDSTPPDAIASLPGFSGTHAVLRRATALFPSFARLGLGRLVLASQYADLPPLARDQVRAFDATARGARSTRDEWAEATRAMEQAQVVESLGGRPLVVVTALRDAATGWLPPQEKLAALSSNSSHRVLLDAKHASIVEDEDDAALATRAIIDTLEAVRTNGQVSRG
jgi:pimeloyl-ACP methyl ester carboxylesterase